MPEFLFTKDGLELFSSIESRLWTKVRELSKKRVRKDQRFTIYVDDIQACLPEALHELMVEIKR